MIKVVLEVKNPPANAGDIRDSGSIPGSGRSPGGGHGNPLQCSCLENPTDREAWRATVHQAAKELDTTETTQERLRRTSITVESFLERKTSNTKIRGRAVSTESHGVKVAK